ncbi:TauD/TfdA family dioxygenase [Novosphingobium sp. TH158]|uniref:TauD/TfdA dioxygenase family protein n=1 Tax=Novosphingobium sp. TH158 TaxID=2067455 RepID=UPI000C7CB715|nr:TauD/TfdA family dioxygenase [Novosphingobium sp. TH158]PLK25507.1 taurine catabolism dioxygenase [Novosphingobium sp. TH158]
MATAAKTGLELRYEKIKDKIGARVLNPKEELLTGELSPAILDLMEEVGVVVFPELHLTDAEQVQFSNSLGGNADELAGQNQDQVFKVSLDEGKQQKNVVEYLKGSLFWHIDGTMNPIPIRASMLSAQVLAPEGGDTLFANTASSYADLPEDRKAKLEGLRVVHSLWCSGFYHTPEPTLEQLEDWQSKGEAEIPLVVTTAAGKKSLVLGNTAHYIPGMDMKESQRILHGLRDFATSEPYVYRHVWKVGDTVMWDNRTSLHKATPYDPYCGRMMHRTIIKGGEAWEVKKG